MDKPTNILGSSNKHWHRNWFDDPKVQVSDFILKFSDCFTPKMVHRAIVMGALLSWPHASQSFDKTKTLGPSHRGSKRGFDSSNRTREEALHVFMNVFTKQKTSWFMSKVSMITCEAVVQMSKQAVTAFTVNKYSHTKNIFFLRGVTVSLITMWRWTTHWYIRNSVKCYVLGFFNTKPSGHTDSMWF